MESIVTELVERLKEENTFLAREKLMMLFFAQLIETLVQLAFQRLDEELAQEWKQKSFQVDRKSVRTVTFLFESIRFQRRRMKNEDGEIRV